MNVINTIKANATVNTATVEYISYDVRSKSWRKLTGKEHADNLVNKAKRDGFLAWVVTRRGDGLVKHYASNGYSEEEIKHYDRVCAGKHGAAVKRIYAQAEETLKEVF